MIHWLRLCRLLAALKSGWHAVKSFSMRIILLWQLCVLRELEIQHGKNGRKLLVSERLLIKSEEQISEAFTGYLREAAGMFESIGKLEFAASCYSDLVEYEKAGKIYMYKCEKLDVAAECFTLAGWRKLTPKDISFPTVNQFAKKVKLFDEGLQYITFKVKKLKNLSKTC